MFLTNFFLFTTVILALFQRAKLPLYVAMFTTTAFAYWQNIVSMPGIVFLGIFTVFTHYYFKSTNLSAKHTCLFATLFVMLAYVLQHKIPGFTNTLVFKQITIGNARHTYTMYHNFDKVMAALILFGCGNLILKEKALDTKSLLQTGLLTILCIFVMILLSYISDYILLDVKYSNIFHLWALNNLLFVCFSEEVIFRGFIQNALINFMPNKLRFNILGIIIAALIFGLAHYSGGLAYIALATIAGLFYGYTYFKTKRILCAMLVHFSLNATHFLLFTYPY